MKKLFIISNRLPINVESVDGVQKLNLSSGGLITAISSYINDVSEKSRNAFDEFYWVGAPCCTQAEWVEAKKEMPGSEYEYLPVFIHSKCYDQYYNGLSNSVIWPLFHYFPSYAEYKMDYFDSYIKANTDFLDVVIRNAKEGDTIWIHDYHLMPLAGMIRKELPNVTIGFFLHIPFPSYELFRLMPNKWQRVILEGMLGADLIGFHTVDYASYFLKSLQMVLGTEAGENVVKHHNRLIKVDVFPISIDFKKYNSAFNYKEVGVLRAGFQHQFADKKILFSVDRLDYTKGVFSRLKAYKLFLQLNPEYKEQVVFIMVIVPSRDTIPKYAERKREIDEFIGSLNSSIGTINWKPVIYQYSHLAFHELLSLYTFCDVALVTPLRDGMNLVAKEFVASRQDKKGVLVLSEMTGAARELTEALMINPNDLESVAHQIKAGVEMGAEEQERRITIMQERIKHYDVVAWAQDYFTQLQSIKAKQHEFEFMFLDKDSKLKLYDSYHASEKRLLLLDYDGTLVPFSLSPEEAKPDADLLYLLKQLSKDEHNIIYVISGRDSTIMEKWFGHLPINLVAEHGAKTRSVSNTTWHIDPNVPKNDKWRKAVYHVMDYYVKRCANSFIEEKEFSIVWHFRKADPEQAKIRVTELHDELKHLSNTLNMNVILANKTVEARIRGIDKGNIVNLLLRKDNYDFILACGDDYTDEDIFKVLSNQANAHTVKIGDEASYAHFNLYTPQMAISLLSFLSNGTHLKESAH